MNENKRSRQIKFRINVHNAASAYFFITGEPKFSEIGYLLINEFVAILRKVYPSHCHTPAYAKNIR